MELEDMKGIGEKTSYTLNKLGISCLDDLVNYYPFRYEIIERSNIKKLEQDDKIIIDGIVEQIPRVIHFKRNMDKMSFGLNTGNLLLSVVIFNRGFLKSRLNIGTKITVIGKYNKRNNLITASDLRFGLLSNKPTIEPVYHVTSGINSNQLNILINRALKDYKQVDYIPDYLIGKYNFYGKNESLVELHNPLTIDSLKRSLTRFKYEELFLFMLKINLLKKIKNKEGLKREVTYKPVLDLINTLPFKLTNDQLTSIKEIYDDLISKKRMNRLLQGDVGSGKTIVAFVALYINYLAGFQGALMAPTEILAKQHYDNLLKTFPNSKIGLLTGKLKVKEKREIYNDLSTGKINIVVGTHALISGEVEYKNLGLVITDEQHRFGVNQRSNLKNKGIMPDVLYMSATPIPRTYAITLFGDMDISYLKEKPAGRKEVVTYLKNDKEIKQVMQLMYNQLKQNHQIYIIVPLIEESEKMDLENINKLKDKMDIVFGKIYNIDIMHGKLSSKAKEEVMQKFKNNEVQILISTTVVEVGVDVGNATVMIVFDSYRFGLSALHQLRGRVGRNSLQSYFVLMSNKEIERLKVLTSTNDGFAVSEADFKLRGSGDLFGIRQSGDMNFKIADLKKDYSILLKAKQDSEEFLMNDPINYKHIYNAVKLFDRLD